MKCENAELRPKKYSQSGWLYISELFQRKNKTRELEYSQIIADSEIQPEKVGGPFTQSFQKYLLHVTTCQTQFQVLEVHQGTKQMNIPAFMGFTFQG